jgi:hypothetical protein
MKTRKTLTREALDNYARIERALARGEKAIQELDKIVRETYRDNPEKLAEWEEAIRLDTSPRKSLRAKPPKSKTKV